MTEYSFNLPSDFEYYAWEVEAKGYFSGGVLEILSARYRVIFYEPTRLKQEIEAELMNQTCFFEPNLIVIPSVTKKNMEAAITLLVQSGNIDCLVAENS